ncbi:MAG: histidine ammonia-lyase, partial [Tissierellia bacterium]|nr:histidine ammonia-lyase [Tissierellia bacterium]
IINNSRRVVATEIMAACQAIDFRADEGFKLGVGTQAAYDLVRENIDFLEFDKDVELYDELEIATDLLEDGSLLDVVEAVVQLDLQ